MSVSKIARNVALGIGGYLAVLSIARKWHLHWGATDNELEQPLPGDELMAYASATHAITINAPAEAVWPWLVQIGQNRAGFYSYTFLENLIAADIHNSNRIVPEWQNLKVGDKVRLATGKVYGDLPLLPVVALEPYRHLVLKGWGAFVLKPIDAHTTRLIIRSHGQYKERMIKKVLNFLAFEPIHFMMERRMLQGIKERAEREYQTVSGNVM